MAFMTSEDWRAKARLKLQTYLKSDQAISFTVEMLSYIRLLHLIFSDKVTLDEVKGDIARMMIALSGAAYELPFFLQTAPRLMPMFQLSIMGVLDSVRYSNKAEESKHLPTEERLRITENMVITRSLHREFVLAVVGTEGGLAKQSTWALGVRQAVDELFEE
jgi:hypothetical protein